MTKIPKPSVQKTWLARCVNHLSDEANDVFGAQELRLLLDVLQAAECADSTGDMIDRVGTAVTNIRSLAPHLIEAAKQEPPHAER